MTSRAGGAWLAAFLAASLAVRSARADGADPAAAAELFRRGRAALLDKKYDEACPALAESQRLDPKVGTLINLALCEEATAKLSSALRHWSEAGDLARTLGDSREGYVHDRQAALAPRVPRVTVRLAPGAPAGTRATLDGAEVVMGEALPVDPGAHVVVATAAARPEKRFDVEIAESQSTEVFVEPAAGLAPLAASPPSAAPRRPPALGAAPPASANAPHDAPAVSRAGGGSQRTIAYAAGAAGVVGIGLGTFWGLQAISAKNDPRCVDGVCADEAAAQAQRDGRAAGDRSTVAFVAGGALLAAGVVLWLTAPKPGPSVAVRPTAGGASLDVGAAW